MTSSIAFLSLAGAGVLLGLYVLCALSRSGWRRWGGPSALVIVYVALSALVFLSMGIPRPMSALPVVGPLLWGATISEDDYAIVGFAYEEDVAIYLCLRPKRGGAPILVQLPWSEEQAEGLYERMQRGIPGGDSPYLNRGDGFDSQEPLFYDQPHDSMPLKNGG